ncbi:hypothetical protein PFISCL1PPCAC_14448, partial [Pristionchus fissidentatus]
QELTLRGVPAILVPIFADQPRNAAMIEHNQLGKVFSKFDIADDEKLTATLREILENEKYRLNAKRTAEMLATKPLSSTELLLKHVDFAARFGQLPALRPLSIEMNWIEYYNIDVILVAFVTSTVLFCLFVFCFVSLLKRCFEIHKRKEE